MPAYTCDLCAKVFKQKTDYERHIKRKNPCTDGKIKMTDIDKTDIDKIDKIMKMLEQLSNTNALLIKSNFDLAKKVDILEKVVKNIKPITINILAFGKEDLSFITDDIKKLILKKGLMGVQKYVELVYCNNEQSGNKNIYISNKKNMNSVMVYDGDKWNLRNDDYIDQLRDKGIEFIEECYENLKNIPGIDKNIIKMADRFIDKINEDDNTGFMEKINKDIKMILYNNRPR